MGRAIAFHSNPVKWTARRRVPKRDTNPVTRRKPHPLRAPALFPAPSLFPAHPAHDSRLTPPPRCSKLWRKMHLPITKFVSTRDRQWQRILNLFAEEGMPFKIRDVKEPSQILIIQVLAAEKQAGLTSHGTTVIFYPAGCNDGDDRAEA